MHILDLLQNSIEAGATRIVLRIEENPAQDRFAIFIEDNGCGMDADMLKKVLDPFVTTKKTRHVGLGLSLIQMSTSRCDGYLQIDSTPLVGTAVKVVYRYHHLDRPPLGQISSTVRLMIIANPELDFHYIHRVNDRIFSIATRELITRLGDISLCHPEVIGWITEWITDGITRLYGGACNEND